MRFIKQFVRRLFSRRRALSESTLNHYQRLETLRDNHQNINLRVNRTSNNYQTLVLEIDHDEQELVIDDLFPAPTSTEIQAGETVELISQAPDCLFNFYTRIIGRQQEGKQISYRLELPNDMGHNHNRKSFRVYVDTERDLSIHLGVDDRGLESARISNLASDGIKLHFADDFSEKLTQGRFFDQAIIKLPDGYSVDCHIQIRNHYLIHSGITRSMAGCTLKVANPQHRHKLAQYLATIQRKQRRRENRVM